jgi:hypothetical protein
MLVDLQRSRCDSVGEKLIPFWNRERPPMQRCGGMPEIGGYNVIFINL